MKLLIVSTGILVLGSAPLIAKAPTQFETDFVVGSRVGQCAKAKCGVFQGVFLTGSPQPGSNVRIRVKQWLLGNENDFESAVIDLPFVGPGGQADKDGIPLDIWLGVNVSPNVPVTVILLLERIGPRFAGEPILVTTDEREAALVSLLSAEARLLQLSPTYVVTIASQASQRSSPGLGGLILGALSTNSFLHDYDLRATVLYDLIQTESVPHIYWQAIALEMTMYYQQNSPDGRLAVIQRLSQLGNNVDPVAGAAGIQALVQLPHMEPALGSLLPIESRDGLVARYRELVAKKKLARAPDWEAALGLARIP
jgi:hypothetical protein